MMSSGFGWNRRMAARVSTPSGLISLSLTRRSSSGTSRLSSLMIFFTEAFFLKYSIAPLSRQEMSRPSNGMSDHDMLNLLEAIRSCSLPSAACVVLPVRT